MNTKNWITSLAVAGVGCGLLSARAVYGVNSSKQALLEELRTACLAVYKNDDRKKATLTCGCLVDYHQDVTHERYLPAVIDTYKKNDSADSPTTPDEIGIVLENDASALEKCERSPNWMKTRRKGGQR